VPNGPYDHVAEARGSFGNVSPSVLTLGISPMASAIVVPILLDNASVDEARKSLLSVVRWRDFAVGHRIADVRIICVCAESSRPRLEQVQWELDQHAVPFRWRTFDTSRPIQPPHALQLFREAEASIGGQELVLLVSPGSALVSLNGLAESVKEIEAEERNIFIAALHKPTALPVAALFSAAIQRARGLMIVAADGWAIRVRRPLLSLRWRYVRWGDGGLLRGVDPSGETIDYDVRWLIGAIACAVEERGGGTLRLRSVGWAE
jgi:hypothetical protein